MSALDLDLLRTWPGRLRFPDLLVALNDSADAPSPDAETLGRAVLGGAGGMSPHAAFDDLLNRGEFAAAEHLLGQWPDARWRGSAELALRLASAREQKTATLRQSVDELVRRAEAADVRFDKPNLTEVLQRAWFRAVAADQFIEPVRSRFEQQVGKATEVLRDRIAEQERSAGTDAGQFASKQLLALLEAGELVAVRARLDREPVGAPIPEAALALPPWTGRWSPEEMLGYHLTPGRSRPPELDRWKPSGKEARQALVAYQQLGTHQAAKAAGEFASALDAFLGVTHPRVTAVPFDGGYMAVLEGVFADDHLSRLHPNGKVDLYIAGPGTTEVPSSVRSMQPHIAVGPDLAPDGYTDRHSTAVLSLQDLLRLFVLPGDRAVGLLSLVAPQWPVDALIGDSAEDLDRILGDDAGSRWLTLRWITHLSLRGAAAAAFEMEQCTGADASLLRVALRYSQDASRDLWNPEDALWRNDPALQQALREVLLARCGPPEARAAWWAAVASCDDDSGAVSRQELLECVDIASEDGESRKSVDDGVDVLLANGLLSQLEPGGELVVPLTGAVRVLRSEAESRLIRALEEMAADAARDVAEPTPSVLTAWHRNRFAVVPAYVAFAEAEREAAEPEELETLAAAMRHELAEDQWADIPPASTSVPEMLADLVEQWRGEYPNVHIDLRCPPVVRVAVPVAVLQTAMYEVLDNAAEAMPGDGGWIVMMTVVVNTPEVLVEVRDNGPGLSAEVSGRRIFGKGASTRGAGRGSGLYRARQLLRRYSNSVVEADMEVIDTPHPTLPGAAVRVVLPAEES